LAYRFARLGCKLVLWDINTEANEETAAGVRDLGAQVDCYMCNLGKRENVYEIANQVV